MRFLLNAHPKIAIPHPPHIMRDFSPFLDVYDDLSEDKNFSALVNDVIQVVNRHFAPWDFEITEQNLMSQIGQRSLYGVYIALYDLYLEKKGKSRWGCKSTFMHRHMEDILKTHADPKFIHLVRDPRDVAVSAKKSIFSKFTAYKTAELWTEEQQNIESWKKKAPDKILSVRYEDLTQNPAFTLKQVMAFIGESFHEDQLQAFQSPEAKSLSQWSESWKNCASPITQKSVGQYHSQLSPKEIAHVEGVAHPLMREYGYTLHGKNFPALPQWQKGIIEFVEIKQLVKTEAQALVKDKNFKLRWKKKLFIEYTRHKRQILGA